jgi:hypothetical protein
LGSPSCPVAVSVSINLLAAQDERIARARAEWGIKILIRGAAAWGVCNRSLSGKRVGC